MEAFDAIVIGAGPAGLATSRELTRRGVGHVVLERGAAIAHTWENLYDSLVLHTGKHLSSLPGLKFPPRTSLFPTRRTFIDYLNLYARTFAVPVRTSSDVVRVEPSEGTWQVVTNDARLEARTVVLATGIVANPIVPELPGRSAFRGRIIHSVEYRRPEPFRGRRVLVVGAGNSAGEIAAELAHGGASVSVAVRSGAHVVPRELLGIPIQYVAWFMAHLPPGARASIVAGIGRLGELTRGPAVLPKPHPSLCPDIPLIGFHLVDAIRQGLIVVRPGVERFDERGVHFTDRSRMDVDDVILATGYRAAVECLDGLVSVDRCGFARRLDRVTSAERTGLYFVGHNYDTRGGLYNISRDARLAAAAVAKELSSVPGWR